MHKEGQNVDQFLRRRTACCILGVVVVTSCATFAGTQGKRAERVLRDLEAGPVTLLGGEKSVWSGKSYESWYRRQSADLWFGGSNMHKDTSGRKMWLPNADLEQIPVAETEVADRKITNRMVELAMSTMTDEGEYTR